MILAVCLCISLFFLGFIIDFSSGGTGPAYGGDSISLYNLPFQTTNKTTVNIYIGYTPAKGVVLYCTYAITDSNNKVIDSSLMLHSTFASEYIINKTLTNLANGKYTFTITAHYADGTIHTPENQTFTVDTSFVYPMLNVISPKNQTYNTNQVDITYHINSKILYSYYCLDNSGSESVDWVWFDGNMTLNGLSNGAHELRIFVVTEANLQIANASEGQIIYFNVNSP